MDLDGLDLQVILVFYQLNSKRFRKLGFGGGPQVLWFGWIWKVREVVVGGGLWKWENGNWRVEFVCSPFLVVVVFVVYIVNLVFGGQDLEVEMSGGPQVLWLEEEVGGWWWKLGFRILKKRKK